MIDLFTAPFSSIGNDQLYSAIVEFTRAQPNESNRHDFKSVWTNDAVKDVAAFANTFGGLLIIGVGKGQNDTQANLIGVTSGSELTTGIASAIATNISPTPSYDITECYEPAATNKRFCVVRIRSDSALHLVTKKGIAPVWIRNADQTIPADAAQLRGLIDRESQIVAQVDDVLTQRAQAILEEMIIGHNYNMDAPDWTGSWQRSYTHFKLALVPREMRLLRLDVQGENKFTELIHRHYRRVASNLHGANPVARDAANRSGDFYEYRWYHRNIDYEGRWRITNRLDLAHATQVKLHENWSLVDTVMYTVLLLKVGAAWWKALGYFGDGILFAELNVGSLELQRGAAHQFMELFGLAGGSYGMNADVLVVHPLQRGESRAYVAVNSATLLDSIPSIVTSVMNPLLRSLGHGVVWGEFEDNVRIIAQGSS
jgi:Schlafen, AlbA_2